MYIYNIYCFVLTVVTYTPNCLNYNGIFAHNIYGFVVLGLCVGTQ